MLGEGAMVVKRVSLSDFKRQSGMWPILCGRVRPQLCRENGTLLPYEPGEVRTGPSFTMRVEVTQ